MSEKETRNFVAELIGTFMFVLVGAGAVALVATSTNPVGADVIVSALAHGLILVAIVGTFGHISGAHVNPAVTLGLLVGGKIDLRNASFYWAAQLIGGLLAGGVLRVLLPEAPATLMGQTAPATDVTIGMLILTEGILTFFLVSTVYQAVVYGKGGSAAPLLIGFTFGAAVLFGGPLTGASLNPARTLGPGLLAKETQDIAEILYYFVGTLLGGLIAGFLHADLFAPEESDNSRKSRRRR